jgi:hypothetical protein
VTTEKYWEYGYEDVVALIPKAEANVVPGDKVQASFIKRLKMWADNYDAFDLTHKQLRFLCQLSRTSPRKFLRGRTTYPFGNEE